MLWLERQTAAMHHPLPHDSAISISGNVEELLYIAWDPWKQADKLYGDWTSICIPYRRMRGQSLVPSWCALLD